VIRVLPDDVVVFDGGSLAGAKIGLKFHNRII
jgi:hypothetical protein